jgi:hypothetical protein
LAALEAQSAGVQAKAAEVRAQVDAMKTLLKGVDPAAVTGTGTSVGVICAPAVVSAVTRGTASKATVVGVVGKAARGVSGSAAKGTPRERATYFPPKGIGKGYPLTKKVMETDGAYSARLTDRIWWDPEEKVALLALLNEFVAARGKHGKGMWASIMAKTDGILPGGTVKRNVQAFKKVVQKCFIRRVDGGYANKPGVVHRRKRAAAPVAAAPLQEAAAPRAVRDHSAAALSLVTLAQRAVITPEKSVAGLYGCGGAMLGDVEVRRSLRGLPK